MPKEVDEPGSLSTVAQLERLGFEVKTAAVPKLGMVLEDTRGPKVANLVDTLPAGNSGPGSGDDDPSRRLPRLLQSPHLGHQAPEGAHPLRHPGTPRPDLQRPVGEQKEISEVLWRGSAEQLAPRQTWLGQPKLELKTGEAISLKSHENFHSIQSVV